MQSQVALGSITTNKASGVDEIAAELFQFLKDDAVKVLYSICQQIWKSQQWPEDWKKSVFIPIPKKGNAKECTNYPIDSTQEYYSRLPFPSPGDLPDQGIEPQSPALQAGTLLSELPGKSIGRLA